MSKYFKIEFPGVFLLDKEKFLKHLICSLSNLLLLICQGKNKDDEMITLSCKINDVIYNSIYSNSVLKINFSTLNNSPFDISYEFINYVYYEWLNSPCEGYDIYENDFFTIEVI